ncbi:GntR family transcriptional regulator [Nesterenkonia cremea]|uniref:GntR family transcriptional regulator n=1 Tax=Nesterenkonia cremea TaxID=1882340 RepID=A0A917ASE9_9MICC|nr:GntR family transcriptional regulator [Nesterenkonia cremea]GGE71714.1 GntR family transcriptional regulator [Nesterenkonia cremea]
MTHDVVWSELSVEGISEHAYGPDRVAEALRERISDGLIQPGTKLPEVRLTQQLEVSRHTLRSAFQILAGEGLVERLPNRGVFVHSPTPEDIQEIYRVRRILEPGAVRAAVFTPGAIRAMQEIVAQARQAKEDGDVDGMGQANQQFHRTLIAQAQSSTLETLMEQVLARMRLVFHAKRGELSFHHAYVERNGKLVEMLAADQRQQAEEYLLDYLDAAEQELLDHLRRV